MSNRFAFLIGNDKFHLESRLSQLQGPTNDLAALDRVFSDPARGKFLVRQFLNKYSYEIMPVIEAALGNAEQNDLILIYYAGHGKQDRDGTLCLATADTRQNALTSTSIRARHLTDLVRRSNCQQVVLILDCCYSGSVEGGLRGDVSSELNTVSNARGFYTLTASGELQAARETKFGPNNLMMGSFTALLVEGIESGSADFEHTGKIVLSNLRRYIEDNINGQTPQYFSRNAFGDPLISYNPTPTPSSLTDELMSDLNSDLWYRRKGAVTALSSIMHGKNQSDQVAARQALALRLEQERDEEVRTAINLAINNKSISTNRTVRNSADLIHNTYSPFTLSKAICITAIAASVSIDLLLTAMTDGLFIFLVIVLFTQVLLPAAISSLINQNLFTNNKNLLSKKIALLGVVIVGPSTILLVLSFCFIKYYLEHSELMPFKLEIIPMLFISALIISSSFFAGLCLRRGIRLLRNKYDNKD